MFLKYACENNLLSLNKPPVAQCLLVLVKLRDLYTGCYRTVTSVPDLLAFMVRQLPALESSVLLTEEILAIR